MVEIISIKKTSRVGSIPMHFRQVIEIISKNAHPHSLTLSKNSSYQLDIPTKTTFKNHYYETTTEKENTMCRWIKKLFTKNKPKKKILYRSSEEQDDEIKELMLLQDPICGKHHG